jgi:hypothetical protein
MEIEQTYWSCLNGRITPEQAVNEIDEAVAGITAVFYTPQRFIIQNHRERISLPSQDRGKKLVRRMETLARLAYRRAQQNGSMFPGELHLSKTASTKHHRRGLARAS